MSSWKWGLGTTIVAAVCATQACSASGGSKSLTQSTADGSGTTSGSGGSTGVGFTTGAGGIDPSSGSGGEKGCAEVAAEAKDGPPAADIVFVIDNSGSMTDEALSVQNSMNDFASILNQSGIDYHVVLISAGKPGSSQGVCVPVPLGSGQCPNDEKLPAFRHIMQSVGSTNGLSMILSTYPQWKAALRPNAGRTLAIITDDDSSLSAQDFTNQLVALDPSFQGFKFHGIIAPVNPDFFKCTFCAPPNCSQCDKCCGSQGFACTPLPAKEGKVYKQLIAQTGGKQGDLCIQEFKPVFKEMATAVAMSAKVPCSYAIPTPPGNQTIDFNKVNVDYKSDPNAKPKEILFVANGPAGCGANGGWYYDDPMKPTKILLCDATCKEVQSTKTGKVSVKFGCATKAI
jgi:hypothetical protein